MDHTLAAFLLFIRLYKGRTERGRIDRKLSPEMPLIAAEVRVLRCWTRPMTFNTERNGFAVITTL